MKKQILEIYNEYGPKHFSRQVKKNNKLWMWVVSRTINFSEHSSISERIYLALNQESNICVNNKHKKFKTFDNGYGYCAKTKHCQCAQQEISRKVSESKQNYSDKKKRQINKKRVKTTLKKYGVTNNAQTDIAKGQHKEFYKNKQNVIDAIGSHKETLLIKYGVENARHIDGVESKIKETMINRYGFDNPMKNQTVANKSKKSREYVYNDDYILNTTYENIKNKLKKDHQIDMLTTRIDYCGVSNQKYYDFKCQKCHNKFQTWLDNGHIPICKICYPTKLSYKSNEELEILDYVQNELKLTCESGNRTLINPYELDIVIPEKKIAIEYCGLYWHSHYSSGKDKKYHLNKLELCKNQGYRLITIFSDEWNFKKHIVKARLTNMFGKTKKTIYARKTIIRNISSSQANTFYDMHHIQGRCRSKYHFGLFFENELVSCMSIGDLRKLLNSKLKKDYYELIRFCSNCNVPGAAGKLFKYFVKTYEPECVISYADRRWNTGDLYNKLNFKLEKSSNPGYWYVEKYLYRHHRSKFQKHKLISDFNGHPKLTEMENMINMGYDVIYDCGQYKFVWFR